MNQYESPCQYPSTVRLRNVEWLCKQMHESAIQWGTGELQDWSHDVALGLEWAGLSGVRAWGPAQHITNLHALFMFGPFWYCHVFSGRAVDHLSLRCIIVPVCFWHWVCLVFLLLCCSMVHWFISFYWMVLRCCIRADPKSFLVDPLWGLICVFIGCIATQWAVYSHSHRPPIWIPFESSEGPFCLCSVFWLSSWSALVYFIRKIKIFLINT